MACVCVGLQLPCNGKNLAATYQVLKVALGLLYTNDYFQICAVCCESWSTMFSSRNSHCYQIKLQVSNKINITFSGSDDKIITHAIDTVGILKKLNHEK